MVRIIIYLIAILLLAWGVVWLAGMPGSVTIDLPTFLDNQIITVKPIVIIGVFIAAMLIAIILWSIWHFLRNSPSAISNFFTGRRYRKGYEALSKGLLAASAGDTHIAKIAATRAQKLLKSEPLTKLLAAQAAQLQGKNAEANLFYNYLAGQEETKLVGLRGLYLEAKNHDNDDQARLIVAKALKEAPNLKWANLAMLDCCIAAKDWGKALPLVEKLYKIGVIDKDKLNRYRATLLTGEALKLFVATPNSNEALQKAKQAQRLAPDIIPSAIVAANILAINGKVAKAAKVLERSWQALPHPEISYCYASLRSGDSAGDRLKRIKVLVKNRPASNESRMVLARAAIDAGEIDLARETIEIYANREPTRGLCLLMAEIESIAGSNHALINAWMVRAENSRPDNMWVANGYVSDTWQPASPITGELDTFRWLEPPHLKTNIIADDFLHRLHYDNNQMLAANAVKQITDDNTDGTDALQPNETDASLVDHDEMINSNQDSKKPDNHAGTDKNKSKAHTEDKKKPPEDKKKPPLSTMETMTTMETMANRDVKTVKNESKSSVVTTDDANIDNDNSKHSDQADSLAKTSSPDQEAEKIDSSSDEHENLFYSERTVIEASIKQPKNNDNDNVIEAKRSLYSDPNGSEDNVNSEDNVDNDESQITPAELSTTAESTPLVESTIATESTARISGHSRESGDNNEDDKPEIIETNTNDQRQALDSDAKPEPDTSRSTDQKDDNPQPVTLSQTPKPKKHTQRQFHIPDDPGVDETVEKTAGKSKWFDRIFN